MCLRRPWRLQLSTASLMRLARLLSLLRPIRASEHSRPGMRSNKISTWCYMLNTCWIGCVRWICARTLIGQYNNAIHPAVVVWKQCSAAHVPYTQFRSQECDGFHNVHISYWETHNLYALYETHIPHIFLWALGVATCERAVVLQSQIRYCSQSAHKLHLLWSVTPTLSMVNTSGSHEKWVGRSMALASTTFRKNFRTL